MFLHLNNVPNQCVRLLYTYNLNSEETGVGLNSRQVAILRQYLILIILSFAQLFLVGSVTVDSERVLKSEFKVFLSY